MFAEYWRIYLLFKDPHWLSGESLEVIFILLCLFIVFPTSPPQFPLHSLPLSLSLSLSFPWLHPLNCITVMVSLTVQHKQTLRWLHLIKQLWNSLNRKQHNKLRFSWATPSIQDSSTQAYEWEMSFWNILDGSGMLRVRPAPSNSIAFNINYISSLSRSEEPRYSDLLTVQYSE